MRSYSGSQGAKPITRPLAASIYVTTSDFPVTKAKHTVEPPPDVSGVGILLCEHGGDGGLSWGVSQTSTWYLMLRLWEQGSLPSGPPLSAPGSSGSFYRPLPAACAVAGGEDVL